MLPSQLINPKSILVVGGSNNLDHLGGSVLKNLLDQGFGGELMVLNPRRRVVQGVRSYQDAAEVPKVELAIFAIPAEGIYPVVKCLIDTNITRAFIVYSAGFSELDEDGRQLEKELLDLINQSGCVLLGPNNIGMANRNYAGIFTKPVPKLDPKGVDYVSGSGATAVFTLEAASRTGLTFNSLITVGNSAQVGIEEVLEHWDQSYLEGESSRVKMMYMETVKNPVKFMKHSISLRRKGCRLVALKSGVTKKGSAAAASHTGAMASPDIFVQAMFDKSGVIRCHSRYALITIAGLLQLSDTSVSRFAVITHAGGPAVILTDHLEKNGLEVPTLGQGHQKILEEILNPGASASNPIDLLATGTAGQLEAVIEYCDTQVDEVDGIVVIFGSPGLGSVSSAYEVIHQQAVSCSKPIFPVLPSVVNLEEEIEKFIARGHIAFFDESLLGRGLGKVAAVRDPRISKDPPSLPEKERIQEMIALEPGGFLSEAKAFELISLAGIRIAHSTLVAKEEQIHSLPQGMKLPLAMKATGILHKTEEHAVELNLRSVEELREAQARLSRIEGCRSLLIQEMTEGTEVYIGAKRTKGYPALVLFGAGGIFVEVVQDIRSALTPLYTDEIIHLVKDLKSYRILEGMRGQQGIDLEAYARAVARVGTLVDEIPRIRELDINPLMAGPDGLVAVDVRIRLSPGVAK
jgi:acetyltransferase